MVPKGGQHRYIGWSRLGSLSAVSQTILLIFRRHEIERTHYKYNDYSILSRPELAENLRAWNLIWKLAFGHDPEGTQ
jgi:hypothetical protein